MVTTETVTGPRHPLDIARDDLYRAGINLGPMLDRPDSTPATLGDLVKVAGPLADALDAALAIAREHLHVDVTRPGLSLVDARRPWRAIEQVPA